MKCLTVVLDDKTLFAGEVVSVQWNEDDETVSVSARFKKQPGFLQAIQEAAAKRAGESNDSPRPTLDVVRDSDA